MFRSFLDHHHQGAMILLAKVIL